MASLEAHVLEGSLPLKKVALFMLVPLNKACKSSFQGSVCGSTTISKEVLEEISNLINKGYVQPVIERVFEIDQAEQAGHYAAKGDTIGKVVIRFR